MIRFPALAMCLALILAGCAPFVPSSRFIGTPMFVQTNVTAANLQGRWYEVASFPAPYQANCGVTTVDYSLREDGLIGVRNRCADLANPAAVREVTGTARIEGSGQFSVQLAGVPIRGRLWVLDLSRDGRTLILGTPSRLSGWVLRRDPSVTPFQMDAAREVFRANGYDVAGLQRTALR